MKRKLLFLMTSVLVLSCAATACGDKPSDPKTTDPVGTEPTKQTESATETEIVQLSDDLPEDIDLGGRVLNVYYAPILKNYMIWQDETGENVDDAIARANMETAEDLNCSFTYAEGSQLDLSPVQRSFSAGDCEWDILDSTQHLTALYIAHSRQMFYNWADTEYLDISQPWWYRSYIEEASPVSGMTYMLAGDIDLTALRKCSLLVLNTDLMNDLDMNIDDVYDTVFSGKWTMDQVYEMTRGAYRELNGNGERDVDDRYGTVCWTASDTDHWLIDSGVRVTERNANGLPEIVFNSEKSADAIGRMYKLFWENEGMYYEENSPGIAMFGDRRALMLLVHFQHLDRLRDSESSYAIVPAPKLDESIDHYSSLVHGDTNIITMLSNVSEPDDVSAVVTRRAKYGHYYAMPEYYEVTLKIKYSMDGDDRRSRMIDLIRDSITTDFAYVYEASLNSIISVWRKVANEKVSDFASVYEQNESKYQSKLNKLLDSFDK